MRFPLLKFFFLVSLFLLPLEGHSSFIGRCIGALRARSLVKKLSTHADFEVGKEYLIVFGAPESARVRFLGAKPSSLKEMLDELSFLDLDSGKIITVKSIEIVDSMPSTLKKHPTYEKHVPYKIQTLEGTVFNGIFLGEHNAGLKRNSLDGSLVFFDLNTKSIVYFDDNDIFNIVKDHETRFVNLLGEDVPNDIRDQLLHDDVYEDVALIKKEGPVEFALQKKAKDKLSTEQLLTLNKFMSTAQEALNKFDKSMAAVFDRVNITKRIHVRFILDDTGQAYTYSDTLEIDGKDAFFIRMPLNLNRSDLGLSLGALLHERGHHYATNKHIVENRRLSLLDDSAFAEGLSDYFAAHIQGDPAVGRQHFEEALWLRNLENRTTLLDGSYVQMKTPLDARVNGELEEHHLGIFYSFPMWSAYKNMIRGGARSRVSPADLWKSIYAKMEANYEMFVDYMNAKKGDDAYISEESETLSNLQFFYVHLYKEAHFGAASHEPKVVESLKFAYEEAKKHFRMPWKEIEKMAEALREFEVSDQQLRNETLPDQTNP